MLNSNNENRQFKYLVETWGCQMNEHDSEIISGILDNNKYEATNSINEADIIILNTCCIRENAEEKVYGRVGKFRKLKQKKPNMIIAIGGCMVQQKGIAENIKKKFPFVDILFGT